MSAYPLSRWTLPVLRAGMGVLLAAWRQILERLGRAGPLRHGWRPTPRRLPRGGLDPEGLRDHYALYRSLMFGPGELSRVDRESIAVAVSAANGCRYWIEHHGAALRLITRDEDLARAIARDWRASAIGSRLRAVLEFAEKLTLDPAGMEREDLDPLREEGLDDRAILEVVEVTAYFNFVNRLADGLGVSLE